MTASPLTLFAIFLRLGLTSFGGPIAHLAYFRDEFVARRRWFDEAHYADIVALSQFVPGPASSQTGFAIGLLRVGLTGGLAAWLGFTLPSAILMLLAAKGLALAEGPLAAGLLHGLKIVTVAIVAQAVWGMAKNLAPDPPRANIALMAAACLIAVSSASLQLAVIAAGAIAGYALLRSLPANTQAKMEMARSKSAAIAAFALFLLLLGGLPVAAQFTSRPDLAMAEAFYRAGALVFGGGHVVLPLLEEALVPPGWVSQANFLAGYGAAQALPGPLFTFAAYLGAILPSGLGSYGGAAMAIAAIFLPGLLLMYAALPFWGALRERADARAALAGVNAAVVGVLAAALYDPIFTNAIKWPEDLALAIAAFTALTFWRFPVLPVVLATAAAGLAITLAQ